MHHRDGHNCSHIVLVFVFVLLVQVVFDLHGGDDSHRRTACIDLRRLLHVSLLRTEAGVPPHQPVRWSASHWDPHTPPVREVWAVPVDPQPVYCICRRPNQLGDYLVCCDVCEEWFHPKCLSLLKDNVTDGTAAWKCPLCRLQGRFDSLIIQDQRTAVERAAQPALFQPGPGRRGTHRCLASTTEHRTVPLPWPFNLQAMWLYEKKAGSEVQAGVYAQARTQSSVAIASAGSTAGSGGGDSPTSAAASADRCGWDLRFRLLRPRDLLQYLSSSLSSTARSWHALTADQPERSERTGSHRTIMRTSEREKVGVVPEIVAGALELGVLVVFASPRVAACVRQLRLRGLRDLNKEACNKLLEDSASADQTTLRRLLELLRTQSALLDPLMDLPSPYTIAAHAAGCGARSVQGADRPVRWPSLDLVSRLPNSDSVMGADMLLFGDAEDTAACGQPAPVPLSPDERGIVPVDLREALAIRAGLDTERAKAWLAEDSAVPCTDRQDVLRYTSSRTRPRNDAQLAATLVPMLSSSADSLPLGAASVTGLSTAWIEQWAELWQRAHRPPLLRPASAPVTQTEAPGSRTKRKRRFVQDESETDSTGPGQEDDTGVKQELKARNDSALRRRARGQQRLLSEQRVAAPVRDNVHLLRFGTSRG